MKPCFSQEVFHNGRFFAIKGTNRLYWCSKKDCMEWYDDSIATIEMGIGQAGYGYINNDSGYWDLPNVIHGMWSTPTGLGIRVNNWVFTLTGDDPLDFQIVSGKA